ncbi:MAG TPA: hypothetical protein VF060_35770 [Trebonia sp.]
MFAASAYGHPEKLNSQSKTASTCQSPDAGAWLTRMFFGLASAWTSRACESILVSAGAWAAHSSVQASRVAGSRRLAGTASIDVAAILVSCSDHGGMSPTVKSASAKNPGRSNSMLPIRANTRPTSAPSLAMLAALPTAPAWPPRLTSSAEAPASTELSGDPSTYSRIIAGRAARCAVAACRAAAAPPDSSAGAGRTYSTSGTGTRWHAAAMTAASIAGSAPPSRATTRSSPNSSRQVSWENPPASVRTPVTSRPSTPAIRSTSSASTSPAYCRRLPGA